MRKHLTGGKLLDVQMEPGDRIVYFTFQCTNEMGDLVQNILCAEPDGPLLQSGAGAERKISMPQSGWI